MRYFLGANTPDGFVSLYDQLETGVPAERIWYIKGGPGNGKSTFMKTLAAAAEAAGESVEMVFCSGDPASLDAVVLRKKRTVYVDATSPHVREPAIPGAVGRYLDLSAFYEPGVSGKRAEIETLFGLYRAEYARCYDMMRAASLCSPEPERDAAAVGEALAASWCGENLESEGDPACRKLFLSALTCKGMVFFGDTLSGTGRVCTLEGPSGFAAAFLRRAVRECSSRGIARIECPDPLCPKEPEALLLPGQRLALLAVKEERPWSGPVWRRIRPDVPDKAPEADFMKCRELRAGILEQAVAHLQSAKRYHDQLEELYRPYVIFRGISSLCRRHIRQLGYAPLPDT